MDTVRTAEYDFEELGGMKLSVRYSEREIDPGSTVTDGMHIHDCFEIYINYGGDVSFVVENNVYKIIKGDIVLTKPNEFHYCLFEKKTLHKNCCLWITPGKNSMLMSDVSEREKGMNNLIRLSPEKSGICMNNIMRLLDENGEDVKTGMRRQLAGLLEILDDVCGHIPGENLVRTIPESSQKIIDFVNDNFTSIKSLNEIYERFYISAGTLNAIFRDNLHITPAKYIETKRLANARKLLLEGKNVSESCEESGFPDYSHFISLFRKTFGVTPGKYIS